MSDNTNNIQEPKFIPYGVTNFADMRKCDMYYVDKTMYIPQIERAARYFFFIRPRRFGKTLTLKMLSCYYDIEAKEAWDDTFRGLWIASHPTSERSSYLMLELSFAQVNGDLNGYRKGMDSYCRIRFSNFGIRYEKYLPKDFLSNLSTIDNAVDQLNYICTTCQQYNLPIYLILDEYDHFTNDILSDESRLLDYEAETHGEGYLRKFFNCIKGGTEGAIKRLFITGVSPVTMDGLTSGFNIAANLTTDPAFNSMMGFTEAEVRQMLDYYIGAYHLDYTTDQLIDYIKPWYDNYCFSPKKQKTETVYNSDMVLYFVNELVWQRGIPENIIDDNVKTDYGKLGMLIRMDQKMAANGDELQVGKLTTLQSIIEKGYIVGNVISSFAGKSIPKRNSFISLLYYLGMLTYGGKTDNGEAKLIIPNEVIRHNTYEFINSIYDRAGLSVDEMTRVNLLWRMARNGEYRPYFEFIEKALKDYSAMRDMISCEQHVHSFVMGMTCLTQYFTAISEPDLQMGHGYADLFFRPNCEAFPAIRYGYVIEFKFAKSSESDAAIERLRSEATEQARRYAASRLVTSNLGGTTLAKLVVIFKGVELKYCEEV